MKDPQLPTSPFDSPTPKDKVKRGTLKEVAKTLQERFNAIPNVRKCMVWSDSRLRMLRARLNEACFDWWDLAQDAMSLMENEPDRFFWLTTNWKPNIEFFMRSSSVPRILEGDFDDKNSFNKRSGYEDYGL